MLGAWGGGLAPPSSKLSGHPGSLLATGVPASQPLPLVEVQRAVKEVVPHRRAGVRAGDAPGWQSPAACLRPQREGKLTVIAGSLWLASLPGSLPTRMLFLLPSLCSQSSPFITYLSTFFSFPNHRKTLYLSRYFLICTLTIM